MSMGLSPPTCWDIFQRPCMDGTTESPVLHVLISLKKCCVHCIFPLRRRKQMAACHLMNQEPTLMLRARGGGGSFLNWQYFLGGAQLERGLCNGAESPTWLHDPCRLMVLNVAETKWLHKPCHLWGRWAKWRHKPNIWGIRMAPLPPPSQGSQG